MLVSKAYILGLARNDQISPVFTGFGAIGMPVA